MLAIGNRRTVQAYILLNVAVESLNTNTQEVSFSVGKNEEKKRENGKEKKPIRTLNSIGTSKFKNDNCMSFLADSHSNSLIEMI